MAGGDTEGEKIEAGVRGSGSRNNWREYFPGKRNRRANFRSGFERE